MDTTKRLRIQWLGVRIPPGPPLHRPRTCLYLRRRSLAFAALRLQPAPGSGWSLRVRVSLDVWGCARNRAQYAHMARPAPRPHGGQSPHGSNRLAHGSVGPRGLPHAPNRRFISPQSRIQAIWPSGPARPVDSPRAPSPRRGGGKAPTAPLCLPLASWGLAGFPTPPTIGSGCPTAPRRPYGCRGQNRERRT